MTGIYYIIVNFNRNIEAGFCIPWFPTFLCQLIAVVIIKYNKCMCISFNWHLGTSKARNWKIPN